MRTKVCRMARLVTLASLVWVTSGCSKDLGLEDRTFPCEASGECQAGYVCDLEQKVCVPREQLPGDVADDTGDVRPDIATPDSGDADGADGDADGTTPPEGYRLEGRLVPSGGFSLSTSDTSPYSLSGTLLPAPVNHTSEGTEYRLQSIGFASQPPSDQGP